MTSSPADETIAADFPHRYNVFGHVLASTVPLDDLPAAADVTGPVRFTLCLGPVPVALDNPHYVDATRQVDAHQFLFTLPRAGRMLIRDGNTIILDPAPGCTNALYTFLRGACLAHLSLMCGQVPLHASALATPAGAVLFTGMSGMGKSSLAAMLCDAGMGLLSDDICHLRLAGAGVELWPLLRELRLWQETVRALNWQNRGSVRLFDKLDKFRFDRPLDSERPVGVRAIYQLAGSPEEKTVSIERLRGVPALRAVLTNVYGARPMGPMGREPAMVQACVGISGRVPVYRLRYPKVFSAMPALIAALQRHWSGHGE